MSKTMKAQINIFDLDAVKEALRELGFAFVENAQWTGWYSNQREQVDVLVEADNSAELRFGVGFRQNSDGGLEIVHEDLGGSGSRELIEQFRRIYGMKAAINQLKKYGYQLTKLADGSYRARSTLATTGMLARRKAKQTGEAVVVCQQVRRF